MDSNSKNEKSDESSERKITLESIREKANQMIADEMDIDKLKEILEVMQKEHKKKDNK